MAMRYLSSPSTAQQYNVSEQHWQLARLVSDRPCTARQTQPACHPAEERGLSGSLARQPQKSVLSTSWLRTAEWPAGRLALASKLTRHLVQLLVKVVQLCTGSHSVLPHEEGHAAAGARSSTAQARGTLKAAAPDTLYSCSSKSSSWAQAAMASCRMKKGVMMGVHPCCTACASAHCMSAMLSSTPSPFRKYPRPPAQARAGS